MYPSVYYVLKDWFGLDLPIFDIFKVFGLLMATAFVVAGFFLSRNLRHQEEKGYLLAIPEKRWVGKMASIPELLLNAFLGFLIGYKFPLIREHFDVFRENPERILFNSDGVVLAGIAAALFFGGFQYWVKKREATNPPREIEELVSPHHRVVDLIMIAALFGILGSKLLSSITDWQAFIADPLGVLLSFQGLTWYGGFIFASLALIVYLKSKKIPLLRFMDAAGPVVLLGYGVGRLGCHFSGDGDWGDPNPNPEKFSFLPDWLWAYSYPGNVAKAGERIPGCEGPYCFELVPPVYPTAIWEFIMCALLFGVLMFLFKRINTAGVLFGIYLIFNGVERFAIESIRVTAEYSVLGFNLTQAQVIALGLIVLGAVMSIYLAYQGKNKALVQS